MKRAAIFTTILILTMIVSYSHFMQPGLGATERTVINDDQDDVLSDLKKGPLTRLIDLGSLEGEEAEDFTEGPSVDISSLTIIQNDTYVSFILTVFGELKTDENYTYLICGYRSEEPNKEDTFDFILEYNSGTSTYKVWEEGDYVEKGNASLYEVTQSSLNITMNRSKFVLGSSEDPYTLCALTILYTGEGKQRYIDIVTTFDLDDDSSNGFDDTTWMIAQVVFIGFMIIGFTVLWNLWSKKKGMEETGGVCPKCEARLDQGLDFCPHCGTFIRGPEADKANPKPRIVSPLVEDEE
jgi:hypothetical protein